MTKPDKPPKVVHVDFRKRAILPTAEQKDAAREEAIKKILERAEKTDW